MPLALHTTTSGHVRAPTVAARARADTSCAQDASSAWPDSEHEHGSDLRVVREHLHAEPLRDCLRRRGNDLDAQLPVLGLNMT